MELEDQDDNELELSGNEGGDSDYLNQDKGKLFIFLLGINDWNMNTSSSI